MGEIEPAFFDEIDEAAEAAADAEGLAQLDAGRGVPHEQVVEWLKTWGTPEETPMPAAWLK
jgi:predicted transcriptional regulator